MNVKFTAQQLLDMRDNLTGAITKNHKYLVSESVMNKLEEDLEWWQTNIEKKK